MTWTQLTAHRKRLGLTSEQMAKLVIGCEHTTYSGWKTRGKIPPYAIASVENFMANTAKNQQWLMDMRRREVGL